VAGLRLEVRDFADLTKWRWVLTDGGGAFVADHEVRLDGKDWQHEAFTDLVGYLSWHAAPDRKREDEARITAEVGTWIGEQVLGPIAVHLTAHRPVTVRVILPNEARDLAFRPLELAHVSDKPLAAQDVTLVMEPPAAPAAQTTPVGARLRVLGLFSLPEGGQPLNLRRERQALVTLIHGIDATGRAADVRVLQYGVTRERLQDSLEEAEGWDVIHVSGHGAPGELLLEAADGSPDRITASELAGLLDLARTRVKLVTVSACWSAAVTAADQRRQLGLPTPDQAPDTKRLRTTRPTRPDPAALATELADRLGCAVLAMRYPVDDEFAIALSQKLYDLLARQGQPLPRAVSIALRQLARDHPALAVATPALFGARAVDLTLAAPKRSAARSYSTDSGDLKMAGFPPQPDRFVGRVGVMARSSAALAAESKIPGVLLHGMPGGGKTACALELGYGHEHAFDRLIWYKAPDDGMAIDGALTDFALTLERYLPGFQMAHACVSAPVLARGDDPPDPPGGLTAFLPRLTELMERRRLLVVVDNAESLLTGSGQWRDDRWGLVLGALTGHNGLGRVVVTSRRVPAALTGLRVEAVDALSADEALLLARELPHLRALIYDELPGLDRDTSRRLALGVLTIAQGHPKLLELADGQAEHPERLAALVEAGDQAWREQGGLPDGFFAVGDATQSAATAADFWHVLAAWTRSVADTLEPGERDLFWFLCCLEEPDRDRWVLDNNWADLWQRLVRDGQPPELDQALAAVAATGLATIRPETEDVGEAYAVHPGVAEAGRHHAGAAFRDAADTEAAAFWHAVYRQASGAAGDGTVHTGLAVRAGLAAVPYLVRQRHWQHAAYLLEQAFVRDPSRANAAAVLPAITQVTRHDPSQADVLALVLRVLDPAAAEAVLREALAAAVAAGDYRAASVMAGRLADRCRDSGRLAEALTLTEQQIGYTRQAGLGPWTQLGDEVWRLQVLVAMGHASHVLAEVTRLRAHMATLPATPGPDETVIPWNVREVLLDTGRDAAIQLGQWADALDLNAAIAASERDRSAPAAGTARTRFNDYGPLLRLGRTEEAIAVLRDCLRIFQDAHDTRRIGNTLSALADAEDQRGHGEAAVRLERDALRHHYLAGDVAGIAISHHNLGNYLRRHARQPAQALASHLAAALIDTLTGAGDYQKAIPKAATELRESGTAATPPASVADLDHQLGDIPGTDLAALLAALSPDPDTTEQALRDLIAQAQDLATTPPAEDSPNPGPTDLASA
jgi:tetratricopeptide (TPR) repeat protein